MSNASGGGIVPFKLPHRAAERVLADLAPLLSGSVPMDRALRIVAAQQSGKREKRAAAVLEAALKEGRPLSSAMAADEAFFGTATVAAVRAGESSGALAESLTRYVQHLGRQAEMRRKLGSAMAYPFAVAVVAVVAFILLLALVVPRIGDLLEALGGLDKAPWPTRLLMAMSGIVRGPWMYVALILVAVAAVVVFIPRSGGSLFRRASRRLPILGGIVEEGVAARSAGALAALLKAGVPLPEALRLCGPAGGDAYFAARMSAIAGEVERGIPMSMALRGVKWKGIPMIAEVAALGEETGALAEEMDWASRELESRATSRSGTLLSLVEPALIVMMAVVVGLVAAALFLPVISLADRLGG
jgi:type II secretory pathway component PulF